MATGRLPSAAFTGANMYTSVVAFSIFDHLLRLYKRYLKPISYYLVEKTIHRICL